MISNLERPGAVVLLMGAIMLGACNGVTEPTEEITGQPIATFQGVPSPSCPAAHAKTVLVDPTHDGGTWWFPQYYPDPNDYYSGAAHQGKALADYLRGRGYTVTELGRNAKMSADSLLTYAIVIRAGYYYNAQNPGYSAGDLAAYSAFIGCSRTLVILAEYLRDGRRDDLADALGMPLTGNITSTISSFSAHAITAGVTSIPYIAGSYLENETNPAIQVLGRVSTGQAVMGLLTRGNSKIFWIGDVNGIQTMPQPFVANLVAWGF